MDTRGGRELSATVLSGSTALLQTLLAQSADMITVSDHSGRIIYANPATERVSGYSITEFFATHPFEMIHPHDRPHCEAAFARLRVVPGLSLDLQHRVKHKDGTWRWIEGTFTSLYHDPTVNGLVAIIRDITDRKRAEERFRHLSESGLISITYFRPTGEIVDANDAFPSMIGYSRDELRQDQVRWDRLTPPEWMPRTRQGILEFQQTGVITPYEKEYFRRDGSRFWGYFGGARLEGAQEGISFIINIDERKRAEAALSASEERYRTLFEAIDEGFCIIELLFDGSGKPVDYRFLEINPAFEQQTGLIDAQGKSIRQLVPDLEPFWFDMYGSIALTGDPRRFEQHAVAMHRWFDVYAFRIGQPDEHKVALLFKDITQRKQTEEALRESELRFRAVADLVPDLLWSNDASGATDWYSQGWLEYTGQTPDQAQSYGWLDAIHPEDLATASRNFRVAIERGESLRHEFRMRGVDGAYHWFLAQVRPVRDEAGKVIRWYGAATDINKERLALAAEQDARTEAETALDIRDQFLAIASHELRTPLTSLIGYTQLLHLRTAQGRAGTERLIDIINRQAERLKTMIEQMLDVTRLQRGQFAVELRPVDIVAIVAAAVDEFRAMLPSGNRHSVNLTCSHASIMLAADPQRLEQIIVNLLSNAVKYSPEGGPVHVRLLQTAAEAVLEVEDEGLGIPAGVQEHIFDPFYRVTNPGQQISGFGLGLHIVQQTVQRHNGNIKVQSTEGVGSTFRVVLPLLGTGEIHS